MTATHDVAPVLDTIVDPPPAKRASPHRAALSGIAAVAVALGVSELASGALQAPSLLISVGDSVIDLVPGWLERWAIEVLGTYDKPVLLASILVVSLAIGALLGVLAARSRHIGSAGFVVFAALGMAAALQEPEPRTVPTLLVTVAGGCAGMLALNFLLLAARPARIGLDGVPIGRRRFVGGVVVSAAVAAAGAAAGRALSGRAEVEAARAAVRLPAPAAPLPRTPAPPSASGTGVGFDIPGLSPQLVPNIDFYRIDTALRVPQIDPSTWSMEVTGLVANPFTLTYADLLAMPQSVADVTLSCVSNEVGGDLVGNARWQGVPLRALLERAGLTADATQVLGRSVDGFTAGFPTQVAMDVDNAMVAVAMNDEPLPVEHGFPARLVVPGLYGYVSATKWLSAIELTRLEDVDGYWISRGWSKDGPVKTQSRIDVPASGRRLAPGRTPVAGVAWAPTRGIEKVEVRVDDGAWQEADLAPSLGVDSWRQWSTPWEATLGSHRLTVRATDSTGQTQTAARTPVAPDGATGHHSVVVQVAPA